MIKDSIEFGSETIDFQLIYSDRKSLGITVTPEMEVVVKAPVDAALDKIKQKLRDKAPWILRQQRFFLSFYPKATPKRFVGGETHLYLGRQYRLKVKEGDTNEVKLKGRFIEVTCSDKEKVEGLLKKWYLEHARIRFKQYAAPWIERFQHYKVAPSNLVLREMPTRWGSCTPKGKIILNPELIKAPKGCIEYVIVHELCHLVHHDHTQKFIDLQEKEMPEWEKWKMRLEMLLA
ncbi:SprT family zinc-dependent metalloprotease [uncultured Pontibacter sp.]|uniref:M48 family metallopeptidase n=1 Tax=uncultured Pontibacter sp. TaxID=453356 RepID=UPI00261CE0E6|nr:SprT family zinc-dependent metalloprotease [uncultured Pontibacter sp.]